MLGPEPMPVHVLPVAKAQVSKPRIRSLLTCVFDCRHQKMDEQRSGLTAFEKQIRARLEATTSTDSSRWPYRRGAEILRANHRAQRNIQRADTGKVSIWIPSSKHSGTTVFF